MQDGAILVGDAGGTNVRFALARAEGARIVLSEIWKRPGEGYSTFEAALDAFLLETKPQMSGAAFGFAGVVTHGQVDLLNRGWSVDLAPIKAKLGVSRLVAVNDFHAMARSAPELAGDQLRSLHPGKPDPEGSLAIGGPGTGFGMGVLRRFAHGWIVLGGEGGHQAFSPQTEIDWKLAEHFRRAGRYLSYEIAAAGIGFGETLEALFEVMGLKPKPLSQAEVIAAAHASDRAALEFCRLRARAVMTAMGDLALVSNASGGVFIAGGVAQHLEPWLREKAALDHFYKRGQRTDLMKPIPISLIASEAAPLIGAAHLWLDEQARGWL
jgi:glucokinase